MLPGPMTDDYTDEPLRYCAVPRRPDPVVPPGLDVDRTSAIVLGRAMWANGTVIHYYFFDRDSAARSSPPDSSAR